MMTTSHALFTYSVVPAGGPVGLAVLGSVVPDLAFWVATAYYVRSAPDLKAAVADAVTDRVAVWTSRAAHSFVVWAIAAALVDLVLPRLMPLMWGWLGHNASDFLTHHAESYAHFYPLSKWKFASPVSYYEWDHHAREYMIIEGMVALAFVLRWFGGASLSIALAALAMGAYVGVLGMRRLKGWLVAPAGPHSPS